MTELTFALQTDTEVCLYQQIYEHIKNEIRSGKLREGEKLPSTRSLAGHLQVARSTVNIAYDQLLAEGYIESLPCRGYFICAPEEPFSGGMGDGRTAETKEAGISQTVSRPVEYRYDFSPTVTDMRDFPFATWKKINKNILVDANSEMFALGSPQGDRELRSTISRYLYLARGVNSTPEQIIIGAGNDYLLMLLEKILDPPVHMAMENPSYKRAYRIFNSFGYRISAISMDEAGLQVNELEQSGADIAYVMPSHQYPTGVIMPIGRRMELLKWARKQPGRYLIEDDYDSEFRYKGKPIPSLQSSDQYGRVIYMGTFSKSIAPAIRISFMILPRELLEKYHNKCYFYSSTVSRVDQKMLNEFIRDGYFERYLNKMRKIYKDKHDLLLEELRSFEQKFVLSGENAGLHVLLTCQAAEGEEELVQRAAAEGVKVYGVGEAYIEEGRREKTVLLGYAGLGKQEIVEGVEGLRRAWL